MATTHDAVCFVGVRNSVKDGPAAGGEQFHHDVTVTLHT
jgi:hypothetical protein